MADDPNVKQLVIIQTELQRRVLEIARQSAAAKQASRRSPFRSVYLRDPADAQELAYYNMGGCRLGAGPRSAKGASISHQSGWTICTLGGVRWQWR